MYKKLITACMALAAFVAFAVMPATASATNDPTLTETGVALAHGSGTTGATVVATNIGDTSFTNTSGSALITCTNAKMTGHVHQNTNGTVEGTITTADFWGTGSTSSDNNTPECTGSFGNAYITVPGDLCIRSTPAMLTDEFQVHKGACTGAQEKVTFIIGSTTAGECKYEATGIIKGDYTTGAEDKLTVRNTQEGSGATLESGGFFCPHSGMLKMSFSLETENGTTVTIS